MPDLDAYTVAADLADFFAANVDDITVPDGCDLPDRIFVSAGEPDIWVCDEIAVWNSAIGATNRPNQDTGIDTTACANAHYVEVNWRYAKCITTSPDGKTPISVADHDKDAACFYSVAFGLYRRVQASWGDIFTLQSDCNKISQDRFELGQRSGGMLTVTQTLRVGLALTDPAQDGS